MHNFRLGRLDKIKWRIHGLITRFTCHDTHAVCYIKFIQKLSRPNRMGYKPWLVKPCAPLNISRHSHGCHTQFQSNEFASRALNSYVTAWQKPWNFLPSHGTILTFTASIKPWPSSRSRDSTSSFTACQKPLHIHEYSNSSRDSSFFVTWCHGFHEAMTLPFSTWLPRSHDPHK